MALKHRLTEKLYFWWSLNTRLPLKTTKIKLQHLFVVKEYPTIETLLFENEINDPVLTHKCRLRVPPGHGSKARMQQAHSGGPWTLFLARGSTGHTAVPPLAGDSGCPGRRHAQMGNTLAQSKLPEQSRRWSSDPSSRDDTIARGMRSARWIRCVLETQWWSKFIITLNVRIFWGSCV